MAGPFALATQILIDGPRNTVTKTTGDITIAAFPNTTIVTASLLSSMLPAMQGPFPPSLLRIDRIEYSISDGMTIQLLWDATTPVLIAELYGRGRIDALDYGGWQNNAGAGVTGNILLNVETAGSSPPAVGTLLLTLELTKQRSVA